MDYNLIRTLADYEEYAGNTGALSRAITDGIVQYKLPDEIFPGVFVGYDPAKDRDRSALVILEQPVPTDENPCPKLLLRAKKNYKGMRFSEQRAQIETLDKLHSFTSMAMDSTRHEETAEQLQDYMGSRLIPIKFSKPVKANMLTNVLKVLQDGILEMDPTHAYHDLLRKELHELDPNTLKHPQTSAGSDDFVWALALAVAAIVQREVSQRVESGFSNDRLVF